MVTITPSLWFDGRVEEALEFYTGLFPDSEVTAISYFGETGPGEPGDILSAEFTLAGRSFDIINGGPSFPFTEAVSFIVSCADQGEVDFYHERLTDGGEESQCGWVKDRYGLSWQIVPTRLVELMTDPDAAKVQRVTETMLSMRKLIIADLEAAAAG